MGYKQLNKKLLEIWYSWDSFKGWTKKKTTGSGRTGAWVFRNAKKMKKAVTNTKGSCDWK